MLVGALRAFVNTHCLRIAVSEFGGGGGCGAGSAATLPPVVQNELVTITPVLLQAAAFEQQVGAQCWCVALCPRVHGTGNGIGGGLASTLTQHGVDVSVAVCLGDLLSACMPHYALHAICMRCCFQHVRFDVPRSQRTCSRVWVTR